MNRKSKRLDSICAKKKLSQYLCVLKSALDEVLNSLFNFQIIVLIVVNRLIFYSYQKQSPRGVL